MIGKIAISPVVLALLVGFTGLGLTACESGPEVKYEYPSKAKGGRAYDKNYGNTGSVLGEGGLNLFGGTQTSLAPGVGLGVNSYLWRASLDTISFMPVNSADPFGGVIITDWHSQNNTPNERFKLNVYILGRALRADGVRVAVFRQVRSAVGWQDAPVPTATGTTIEDSILTRARQLRNETLNQ